MYDARVPALWRKVRIYLNNLEMIQPTIFLGFSYVFSCFELYCSVILLRNKDKNQVCCATELKDSQVHVNVVEVLCSAKERYKPYSLIWSMAHWTFF